MTTNETTVTDETTEAAEYVSAIVAQARERMAAARAAKVQVEQEAAQERTRKHAEMLEIARASAPDVIRPFVTVENYSWNNYRAVISLPDCAPFCVDMNESGFTRWFYRAYASIDNSGDYEPALYIHEETLASDLDTETARAYEAQREYDQALAIWTLTQAEREHANAMSERESALRHEEEPEPPATLQTLTSDEILAEAAENIRDMGTAPTYARERFLYRRAMALCAYVSARNTISVTPF